MASSEGQIYHCVGIRLRATGSASLKLRLLSRNQVRTSTLMPLDVIPVNDRELDRRANFKQQSMQLELVTTGINEYFLISKITFFVKVSANSYPQ